MSIGSFCFDNMFVIVGMDDNKSFANRDESSTPITVKKYCDSKKFNVKKTDKIVINCNKIVRMNCENNILYKDNVNKEERIKFNN